jgi:hypothetical protein
MQELSRPLPAAVRCPARYNGASEVWIGSRKEANVRVSRLILMEVAAVSLLVTACTNPFRAIPAATATPKARRTRTPSPSEFATPSGVVTAQLFPTIASTSPQPLPATPAPATDFCADAQPPALINSLKSAILKSDGPLLASLVSPTHGFDARAFRNGRVVNYDQAHAKFLFETTFAVDWGPAPGSGLEAQGSFHEVIVPALIGVLNADYTSACNQIQIGGATYQATWPYSGINFYSLYFAGTPANGNLDWHTWLLGMHYVSGKPYLYAIMPFQWET